ncbi:hypothetical protein KIW84_044603 [Lathyrus oleraceus]|uniref:Uncharacterized protein n=1 Tax=Pisum sativum TaxID=3888 RepID=A0A9D4XKZ7_PEA|nr:hypothetical protein KIW84_044603 [Pisum sativum]
MDKVLLIEEKDEVLTKKGSSWRDRGGTLRIKDPGDFGGSKKEGEKTNTAGNEKFKGRRLNPAELEERNSSEEEETEENVGIQPQKIEEQVEKLQTLQLSMQSKEGFTSDKSFKVWVKVKDKELLTLIDSGATDNFIDSRLVKELDLKVVETPTYVIEWEDQKYKIQGDPALCTRQASWKAMVKALTDEGLGFYLQTLETDTGLSPLS